MISKLLKKIKVYLRRIKNAKTAYIYPSECIGWKKYKNPVIGGKNEVYFDPFVRQLNDKYAMIVSYRNNNTLRMAFSSDGISWSDPCTILEGREGCWDAIVNRASYLFLNNTYYVWFTGQNNGRSAIGLALSKDGVNFNRYCDNAIIVANQNYEGISVMNPCVIWDDTENIFKMWYSAGENYEPDVICYATSLDGINWTKYSGNPVLVKGTKKYDCAKIGGCDVIKYDGEYHMFYIGYENIDNARICHAISEDGITWERDNNNPILSPSKHSWDKHAVYKPTVCIEKNIIFLWYNGRTNKKEYIGFAYKSYRN